VKGLYRRALAGEFQNFTGVSNPYEEPWDAELVVETAGESREASVRRVLTQLELMGYLPQKAEESEATCRPG